MQKIIQAQVQAVIEHYCDLCGQIVMVTGIDENDLPDFGKEFSMAITMNFGHKSVFQGLTGNLALCNNCSQKLIQSMLNTFGLTLEELEAKADEWKFESN